MSQQAVESIPAKRILDLFTRQNELLLLLHNDLQRLAGITPVVAPAPPPTAARARALGALERERLRVIALLESQATTFTETKGLPVFQFPLPAKFLELLPLLAALVQTLGYDHHQFTTVSYTTSIVKTDFKTLDVRLDPGTGILAEQVLVSPTTDCRIDFETKTEKPVLTSSTPVVLANQSFNSPLHATAVLTQGKTAAGTLNMFLYWR